MGEQTGKQWAAHSREQRSNVPRAASKVRGAAGGRSRGRQEWRRAGKGGRRASWTWGFVWLLCGFYSSSVSPRLSWGKFGLQSRKVRAAADTNRSFKCIQLFTFALSYKQTVKCIIWPEYLSPTSDWICMCKCACQSLRSHEISFLRMLVQTLCVQSVKYMVLPCLKTSICAGSKDLKSAGTSPLISVWNKGNKQTMCSMHHL